MPKRDMHGTHRVLLPRELWKHAPAIPHPGVLFLSSFLLNFLFVKFKTMQDCLKELAKVSPAARDRA